MDKSNEELQKPKLQTPRRRLGLGLRSPRVEQSTPSTSRIPAVRFHSPLATDTTETPKKKAKISKIDIKTETNAPTENQTVEIVDETKPSTSNENANNRSVEEIQANIERMEQRLQRHEKQQKEIKKLEELIEMWRSGGQRVLEALQNEMEPHQEQENILLHYNLPTDIFDVKKKLN